MEKAGTKLTQTKGITKREHENNRQKERDRVGKWREKKEKKGGRGKKRRKMYKERSSIFAS